MYFGKYFNNKMCAVICVHRTLGSVYEIVKLPDCRSIRLSVCYILGSIFLQFIFMIVKPQSKKPQMKTTATTTKS